MSAVSGDALRQVLTTIGTFDKKWSRFRADSLITKRSKTPGKIPLEADEYAMLELYRQLYGLSAGAVTPLIGQTLADMGYDATYSLLARRSIRSAQAWDSTLELAPSVLTLRSPALLDIGAAGKGLLVDRVVTILKQYLDVFVVDAGGDIYVHGHSEEVGLEKPDDSSQAIGTVSVQDRGFCGSASNRRAWAGYQHIIDGRHAAPATSVIATWALGTSTMEADMATTALFFIDPHVLAQVLNTTYVVMYPDNTVRYAKDKEITIYG